jgi:hypothetical protein
MNERDLEQHLYEMFNDAAAGFDGGIPSELTDDDQGIARVSTFEEDGVLTRNAGLVLRMRDGTDLQITIVRSR